MIKSILFLFSITLYTTSYGQLGEMTQKDVDPIINSTTYFVLDQEENSNYNLATKECVEKFWELTPYKFIKHSELEEHIKKTNATFVLKLIFDYNSSNTASSMSYCFNPKTNQYERNFAKNMNLPGLAYRYDGIALVKGGGMNSKFTWHDWKAYSIVNDVTKPEDFYFRMGTYIQVIQHYVNYIKSIDKGNLTLSKGKEYYNVRKVELKSKVLYLRKEDLPEKLNLQTIKESYQYEVKFATDEEIKKAILEKDPKVALLNAATSGNRFYPYFTETETGKVLYLDMDRNYLVHPSKSVLKLLKEVSE